MRERLQPRKTISEVLVVLYHQYRFLEERIERIIEDIARIAANKDREALIASNGNVEGIAESRWRFIPIHRPSASIDCGEEAAILQSTDGGDGKPALGKNHDIVERHPGPALMLLHSVQGARSSSLQPCEVGAGVFAGGMIAAVDCDGETLGSGLQETNDARIAAAIVEWNEGHRQRNSCATQIC